jgi:predicted short-subunit dehydrogenase-like oxidoreductase (DUF2520 family)
MATSPNFRIGFVGAGRAGSALALALVNAGHTVIAVASRTPASAEALAARLPDARAMTLQDAIDACDLIFITTPDAAIRMVDEAGRWRRGVAAVHTSGVEDRHLLRVAAEQGAETGSLHPLQTFADREHGYENVSGSVFGVEAEDRLRQTLLALVEALGGRAVELKALDKAMYHASATLASNYVVTLMHLASRLWQRFGWEPEAAALALLPLLQGTARNIGNLGVGQALTGPIARGDFATISRHVEALATADAGLLATYRQLGLQTVSLAREQGSLGPAAAGDIERLLGAVDMQHSSSRAN